MADDFTDTVVTRESRASGEDRVVSRAPIQETMEEGDTRSMVDVGEDSFPDSGMGDRVLSSELLAKIDALGKKDEPEDDDTSEQAAGTAPSQERGAGTTTQSETPAAAPAPTAAAKDDRDERIARYEAANKRLLAELETERGKPAPESASVHKLAVEALAEYLDNPRDSIRKFIAAALNVEDPKHADVDEELAGHYQDLTAKELGVSLDTAVQAKRQAALTRHLVAREKRERLAQGTTTAGKAQQDAATRQADGAAEFIGNRLSVKRDEGKTLADEYPLTMAFAHRLDGMKPEMLLWKVMERESQTGRLVLTEDDDANVRTAARLIEDHYQALADDIVKARTKNQPPSTAKPSDKSPAAATNARQDKRQDHGARAITATDASVAPNTTPPAKKPDATSERPKFKSNKERQDWALRHLAK